MNDDLRRRDLRMMKAAMAALTVAGVIGCLATSDKEFFPLWMMLGLLGFFGFVIARFIE